MVLGSAWFREPAASEERVLLSGIRSTEYGLTLSFCLSPLFDTHHSRRTHAPLLITSAWSMEYVCTICPPSLRSMSHLFLFLESVNLLYWVLLARTRRFLALVSLEGIKSHLVVDSIERAQLVLYMPMPLEYLGTLPICSRLDCIELTVRMH